MGNPSSHHFRLVAELRWQLFRNAVRVPRGRFEFLSKLLIALLGSAIVLGIGVILGAAAWALVSKTKAAGLPVLLWPLFIFWQFGPLLVELSSPPVDFRLLARFPVPFGAYSLIYAAFRVLDPVTLTCIFWLFCLWIGAVLARPAWALPAAVLFTSFTALNMLFSIVAGSLTERLMRTRRGKELFAGGLMGLLFLSQIVIIAVLPKLSAASFRAFLKTLNQLSPPGLTAAALGNNIVPALLSAAGLAAYALAAFLGARGLLRRLYAGELISDSRPGRRGSARPGWRMPGFSAIFSAALEKEIRYSLFDMRTLISVFGGPVGGLLVVMAAQLPRAPTTRPSSFPIIYLVVLGFSIFSLGEMAYNSFGYDSHGVNRWLLAPVPLRAAFLAKNVVVALLMVVCFALTTLVMSHAPVFPWDIVPVAAAGIVFVCLATMAAGNLFSVWFPAAIEYGTFSARNPSGATILLGLLVKAAIVGCFELVFYAWRQWQMAWVPAIGIPLLVVAAALFYRFSLRAAPAYMERHAEKMASALM